MQNKNFNRKNKPWKKFFYRENHLLPIDLRTNMETSRPINRLQHYHRVLSVFPGIKYS